MSRLYLFVLPCLLSACGGSNSGPQTFEALINDGDRIADASDSVTVTNPSTLPRSGGAQFNGVLAASADGFQIVAGDLTMDVDFSNDANPISGSVTNFVAQDGERISGSLVIDAPILDRNANTSTSYSFGADLTGELRDSVDSYDIDGFIVGDFLGTNYAYVEGAVSGIVTVGSTGDIVEIDGAFIAER